MCHIYIYITYDICIQITTPAAANSIMIASAVDEISVRWISDDGQWHFSTKGDIIWNDMTGAEPGIVAKFVGGK